MRLADAFPILRLAVPYHPAMARALDLDPAACVLFSQLWFWSERRSNEDGWFDISQSDIADALAVTPKVQRRARKDLVGAGLIEEWRGKTLKFRVDVAELEKRLQSAQRSFPPSSKRPSGTSEVPIGHIDTSITKKRERGGTPALIDDQPLSFKEILDGKVDGGTKNSLKGCPERIMLPLLSQWATLWGRRSATLTRERKSAFRRAVEDTDPKESPMPSTFAKALVGMRYDNWPDRKHNCDWPLVVKSLDKWLSLYAANAGRPIPLTLNAAFKQVKGVMVPVGYVWDSQDDHLLGQGFKFDLEKGRWL